MAASSTPSVRTAGRYVLGEEIGAGGMATIHVALARGSGGFGRVVAIKRLKPAFARDPEFTAMLLDEARVAACVHHPNVVSTIDVVAEHDEMFLVIEYVHGESLSHLLGGESEARIPPAIASAILVDALHGLHAAHEAKDGSGTPLEVVHRDVTPHNVLVGADGLARVFDFGIAKAAGRSQVTREGTVKGKLGYMAPEQLKGMTTRASDVYGAGVCLWETLTGKRLFESENESAVLAKVLAGLVDAPSRHVPDLPKELDDVVLRALARDPARRFASAREMADALARAVPPATAVDVGGFVDERAGEILRERAKEVSRTEALVDVALQEDGSVVTIIPRSPRAAAPPSPAPLPFFARPRVLAAVLVALAALLGATLFAVVSIGPGGPTAASAAPPGEVGQTESVQTAPMPPPSVVSAEDPVAPIASEAAPVAPAQGATHEAARGGHAPGRAARPNCSPPYSVDESGMRHYKKECLR